jgi:hypothetical protein
VDSHIAFRDHSHTHAINPTISQLKDYLLLFLAADLRMDPALRPRPVSSVAFAYLGNAYNSTTRLNDGIFTVHQFSVATSARLNQSEYLFRFVVYGGIFDNPPGLLSARGTDCSWFLVFVFVFLSFV